MRSPRLLPTVLLVLLLACGGETTGPVVVSVEITPGAVDLAPDEPQQLTAVPRDAGGKPISGQTVNWQSADPSVVTIDQNGLAMGVNPGQTSVTASVGGIIGSIHAFVPSLRVDTATVVVDSTSTYLVSDSVQQAAGTYVFAFNGSSPAIRVGSVIVGAQGGGFLRRVTGASTSGNQMILQTTQATLSDILKSGTFQTNIPFASQGASGTPVTELRWGKRRVVESVVPVSSTDKDWVFNLNYSKELCPGDIPYLETCVTLSLSLPNAHVAYAALQPDVDFEMGFLGPKHVQFVSHGNLVVGSDINLELAASSSVKAECDLIVNYPPLAGNPQPHCPKFAQHLVTIANDFVGFAGPVPILGSVELSLDLVFSWGATGTVDFTTGFDLESPVSVGIDWRPCCQSPFVFNVPFQANGRSLTFQNVAGEFGAKVAIVPRLSLKFYTVASAFIEADGYARTAMGVSQSAQGQTSLQGGTYYGFESSIGLSFDLIGHNLGEVSTDLYSIEKPFFSVTYDKRTSIVSGNGQSGEVNSPLTQPIVVRVTDLLGNAAGGIPVTFSPDPQGGAMQPAAAVTNAQGLAGAVWTLGPVQGTQSATATTVNALGSPITFSAQAGPEPPPAAPMNLVASAASTTQINLQWNDNSNNEDGFKIERAPGLTATFSEIATVGVNQTNYPNTGLSSGTIYNYRVRAYDAAGNSGYSNTDTAITQRPTGFVYGEVYTHGIPLPGVTVVVTPGNHSDTTGIDGTYQISQVPAGSATVSVGSLPVGCKAPSSENVDVQADNGVESLFPVACAPTRMATGFAHTCALFLLNRYCWGGNDSGQLGNNTTFPQTTPSLVRDEWTGSSLAAGSFHTCGITNDANAVCWGGNSKGQLGDGTNTSALDPIFVVGGHVFVQIVAGDNHTCGRTSPGVAYCWGENNDGQLGNGTTSPQTAPVLVSGGYSFKQLVAGGNHTCGLTGPGIALCWGSNLSGELGTGETTTYDGEPVSVGYNLTFDSLSAGVAHTCGVTTTGKAYCWGSNEYGQLGNGDSSHSNSYLPVAVVGGLVFSKLVAGFSHSCGVTNTGLAYCWGNNEFGELGDQTNNGTMSPTKVSGNYFFTFLSAGHDHTCGVTNTADTFCWGSNYSGQLGIGTTSEFENRPTLVFWH